MWMLAALAAATATACPTEPDGRQGPAYGRDAAAFLPKGWTQESLHQPDLNGDGKLDRVLVARAPDNEARRLIAAVSTPRGYRNVGEAALPGYPLGDASVTFNTRKVLLVTDLVGGTTANQTEMRYRYEGPSATSGVMRFIGLDITNYSRTNRHDAVRLSFNWLTGEGFRQVDKLTKAGDYAPGKPVRWKRDVRCMGMADTPDPDDVLSAEVPHGDSR